MSSGVDVQRRPKIWSYFSFSSTPRRRVSVSLPTAKRTEDPYDPYEKPDRHTRRTTGSMGGDIKNMNHGQRTRYLKAAGLIAFIVFAFYFLAPRRSFNDQGPLPGGDVASDSSVATEKCTKSYSSDKPLIQYALMIDAGSQGSRIHVYRFNNCGPTPELEDEKFEMTPKREGGSGLSAYGEDADGAAKSLDVLLDVAMQTVPDKLKGCSPIAVKATAGLRKLGEELSNKILARVRQHLENDYPFPVVSDEFGGVEVMDGKDEGVYAWITINYLLGKIGQPEKTPSAAILDLGGGSTQIVFEPTFKPDGEKFAPGDHKYGLSFGGREFELYQHSYLGYGLMEARDQLNALVLNQAYENNKGATSNEWLKIPIVNPCFIPGISKEIPVPLRKDHPLGDKVKVTMVGPKTGSPAQCRQIAEHILLKDSPCDMTPCAFKGVYQPNLAKTFATNDVYLVSYFYDRMNELGMPSSFSIAEMKDLTERVCSGEGEGNWDVFSPEAVKELKDRPQACLDLNFMIALLHTGYEFPIDREVKIAKKLNGNELGWCLGASLPLLNKNSGWQCKVREIPV